MREPRAFLERHERLRVAGPVLRISEANQQVGAFGCGPLERDRDVERDSVVTCGLGGCEVIERLIAGTGRPVLRLGRTTGEHAVARELDDHVGGQLLDALFQRVGGEPLKAFKPVQHRQPMLSLDNTYSQAELLAILKTSPGTGTKSDASLILADQLIAAKLNVANGSNPCLFADAIAAAATKGRDMNAAAVVTFDGSGQGACLYTELIDLHSLGSLYVRRASFIEFNNERQGREVKNELGRPLFFAKSRAACLAWEQTRDLGFASTKEAP